jgi:glycosyltransferase involved in cell wall biosynthesis
VVFTVPDKINPLFLADSAAMYNLLFRSVWETMNQFFYSRLQAEGGMITVLHTWGQNLSLHPHIHCIVPGGGIDWKGHWKSVSVSENGNVFLFPVKALSKVFRAKLLTKLVYLFPAQSNCIKLSWKTEWVVYAKEPFAGPASVVEYLGRYTHKIAMSNHRLLGINDQGVTFRWRDYRDNHQKIMTLDGIEFLRRFSRHILPSGFVRIRYYGILSATRKEDFRHLQISMGIPPSPVNKKKNRKPWKEICKTHLSYDPDQCPYCRSGKMVMVERFTPQRGPPLHFLKTKVS